MSNYRKYPVRSSAILTSSYVAGTVVELDPGANQIVIYLGFTIGSLTTMELKVEFSNDNTTFYQETHQDSVTSGVAAQVLKSHQLSATGNYRIPIPVKDRFVKISVKGTGTATSSLATVDVISDKV